MGIWWVNHNQTYKQELYGGYIWSPKRNQGGSFNQTYENLTKVNINDLVFSFANSKIMAIGIAQQKALSVPRPSEFGSLGEQWNIDGWLVGINWQLLDSPFSPKEHIQVISPHLPDKYSPIQKNGTGNQVIYLAKLNQDLGNILLDLSGIKEEIYSLINEINLDENEKEKLLEIQNQNIAETEKKQLINARIGQGTFRIRVEEIEKCCRITGLTE